ncbi:phage tail tape measure protein [Pseudooceanicola nanhaiensis]|uniref:phage tail tape measure protein n=1 Tax=Pseudooceanicola nanhaiensis TaxID=375761 RepID=UPI0035177F5B
MSNAVVGALRVDLGLDSSAFAAGLQNARNSLQGVGKSMARVGANMSAAVTAPLAGLAGLTLRTAGEFEAGMNRVQAALGASEDEFTALRGAARDLGATTQFSATEAANAIEILAKNGLTASEILGGALESSLTLAASAGTDMASAGDLATDVMLNFGKGAEDLSTVVDGVNGVLLASKFGFDDYRMALAQAGGVAGGLGVSLEEFNAVIAATSSTFASGSDAGTSFKTFLQRLVPASAPAAGAMRELGLEFFDAQGNMKSMADIAQELQDGLSGLSEEARSEALTTIFGQDALRTAIGLMREGSAGIAELDAAIGSASASDQAAARMKGLNGTMKELRSAFEELQLAIADSGLLEAFTSLVKGAAGLARQVGELDPKFLKAGVAIGALGAVIGPILVTLGLMVTALGAVSAPVLAVVAVIGTLTAAAIALSPELVAAKDAILGFGAKVVEVVSTLAGDIAAAFAELPAQMVQIGKDILNGLWQGLTSKYQEVKDGITGFAGGLVESVKVKLGIQSPSKVFREIGTNIMQGLGQGLENTGAQVQSSMGGVFQGINTQIKGLIKGVLTNTMSLKEGVSGILGGLADRFLNLGIDSLFSMIPGFATGTNYAPGGLAWVGERGPELVNLPRGSQVTPSHELSDMSGGSAQSVVRVELSPDLVGAILEEARGQSVQITRQGMNEYSTAVAPGRQAQIARDPRRRG